MYEKRDIKRQKKPRKRSQKEEKYDFLPPELEFTGKKISNQKA